MGPPLVTIRARCRVRWEAVLLGPWSVPDLVVSKDSLDRGGKTRWAHDRSVSPARLGISLTSQLDSETDAQRNGLGGRSTPVTTVTMLCTISSSIFGELMPRRMTGWLSS